MTHAIATERLTKYYGPRCVVNCLNLRVPTGTVYGLLGRNGAGKSTTIKMLMGMAQPNFGEIELLGSRNRRPAARGSRTHRLPGGGASPVRLDDGRRGRAVRPLVPSRPLESAIAGADSRAFRDPLAVEAPPAVERPACQRCPGARRSPPIPTCSCSTIPRWASIRSPAATS